MNVVDLFHLAVETETVTVDLLPTTTIRAVVLLLLLLTVTADLSLPLQGILPLTITTLADRNV